MQADYWTLFTLSLTGIILSVILCAVMAVLFVKRKIHLKYFLVGATVLLLCIFACAYIFVPCVKDYELAANGNFIEENATVVEFTYVRDDPDGNGETQYSSPKFYIESKDEYVVLNVSGVEIGKTYRIRFYPNTGICEIVGVVEQVE